MSDVSISNQKVTGLTPDTLLDRRQAKPGAYAAARRAGLAKRCFDIVGASALLVFVAPVFVTLYLLLLLGDGAPIYRHARVGLRGRSFHCLKFRSMVRDADAVLQRHLAADPAAAAEWRARRKLARDPRVTPLGRWLRATSLDELPQLLNVLRGEMSLVGPRPVVAAELELHYGSAGTSAYLACPPGITGLWQISGRSDTTYGERVALDIRYAQTRSLSLDLRILCATLPAVLRRRGAM